MPDETPDLTILPRFLQHLRGRARGTTVFAEQLLEASAEVLALWGPEQMDVWGMEVSYRGRVIAFGIERGYADEVLVSLVARDQWTTMTTVMIAWAGAHNVDFQITDAYFLRADLDVGEHGMTAVAWLVAGHDAEVAAVMAARERYLAQENDLRWNARGLPTAEALAAVRAAGARDITAVARGEI